MIKRHALMAFMFVCLLITPLLVSTGSGVVHAATAANCGPSGSDFLGFPTWYKYLKPEFKVDECSLTINFPDDVGKILLAIVEIALRIAALVAIGFIINGGFKFILSQGEPDKATSARHTIINAVIGLVIAMLATLIVNLIGRNIA